MPSWISMPLGISGPSAPSGRYGSISRRVQPPSPWCFARCRRSGSRCASLNSKGKPAAGSATTLWGLLPQDPGRAVGPLARIRGSELSRSE